jgi:endoglucanase
LAAQPQLSAHADHAPCAITLNWLGQIAASSLKVIAGSAPLGFAPEWADYHAKNGFQAGDQTVSEGSFNAIRVYLWAGMLDSRDPAYPVLLKKLAPMGRYVASNGLPPREINIHSGVSNGSGAAGFSAALLPFLKASGMSGALHQQSLRVRALSPLDRTDNYYDQVLTLFGLGWIEDRYKFDRNGLLKPRWTCTKN